VVTGRIAAAVAAVTMAGADPAVARLRATARKIRTVLIGPLPLGCPVLARFADRS
jgi:hypothetical protein